LRVTGAHCQRTHTCPCFGRRLALIGAARESVTGPRVTDRLVGGGPWAAKASSGAGLGARPAELVRGGQVQAHPPPCGHTLDHSQDQCRHSDVECFAEAAGQPDVVRIGVEGLHGRGKAERVAQGAWIRERAADESAVS